MSLSCRSQMMLFNINHNILTELKYEEVEIVECDP